MILNTFHLRGGRPGVILSTILGYIIRPPLAADLARLCLQGTKDCATWVALPPAPCSLSPILISYSTLYYIQCSVIGSRSSGLPGGIVLRLSTGRAVYVRGIDILVVSDSTTRPLKLYYPS